MDFFEVVQKRRSVRRFKDTPFSDEAVKKALEAAVLAPNSSNTQTWDFHWVKRPVLKQMVVEACLSQSAARTAAHLIVVTANAGHWRRSRERLIEWVTKAGVHKSVINYYEKIVPFMYISGVLNIFAPVKWLMSFSVGFFRPIMREPITNRDISEVAIKSAALAAENFVLAITAQGGATCMMEGFDSWRLCRALKLSWGTRIVMVIAVGYEGERALWGPQFRLPLEEVVHVYE
jgi:nitroreductase